MQPKRMHLIWKEHVIEKELFYHRINNINIRGAWLSVVQDLSSFNGALKTLCRKKRRRIPTFSLVHKLFSEAIKARFLDVDEVNELFNFDQPSQQKTKQLLQEYDGEHEMIIISTYVSQRHEIMGIYVDTFKYPDLKALTAKLRASDIGDIPTDQEIRTMFPNDTAEAVQEMVTGIYQVLYTQCGNCGAKNKILKSCATCRAVKYCSKECQTASWKLSHRKNCKLIGKMAASLFMII